MKGPWAGGPKKIVIVGLGLIGGSLAKALVQRTRHRVLGVDVDDDALLDACSCGAVHGKAGPGDLESADLVYLCVYPEAALEFVRQWGPRLKEGCILTDTCGVKQAVCAGVEKLRGQGRYVFVGGHPMAGKELSGFAASDPSIFVGASYLIAPCGAPAWAVEAVESLALELGFGRVVTTTPEEHDQVIAYTSQVPHVLACAYVMSPRCQKHKGFSAGSYRDVSRVANINHALWTRLFLDNREDLVAELDELSRNLQQFRDAVAAGDGEALDGLLRTAAEIKRRETERGIGIGKGRCGKMTIDVRTARPYQVTIRKGGLDRVGEILARVKQPGCKAMVISDSHVFPLYGERVEASLAKAGYRVSRFQFPAGEESKQLATVCRMYEALAQNDFTRSDLVVTLGGGVAGDMGGFAAATYLRGIAFAQVPTSLLAQVDASVGGKTGVDLPFGKNLVGAFHQPLAVVADPETLKTLPQHFFRDGLGEVIKYGCIQSPGLFRALEEGTALKDLEGVLAQCITCKKELVEEDARDTGRRMILNFGHTFGHALEKLHDFKELSHGEAVGIGMVMACRAGENLGVTPAGTARRVKAVLEQYGLPTQDRFTKEEVVAATALDKKSDGDTLRLILLEDIGRAVIHPIRREQLLAAL